MKKSTSLVLATILTSLFLVKNSTAQTQRAVVTLSKSQFQTVGDNKYKHVADWVNLPLPQKKGQFLAVSVVWFSEDWVEGRDLMAIYFAQKGISTKRFNILPDGHADPSPGKYVSELIFLEHDAQSFNLQLVGKSLPDSIAVHFFDPGLTLLQNANPHNFIPQTSDRAACTCPQPAYEGRLDWCPDGSCPTDPTPEFVPDPTHIIVHHTAGTNVASDWAAVVRSIWDFHVNVNGWDDVGYNWLVDPNGVLYEGRGDGRLGAHFCAQNGKTTGICVMGDFTNIQPTSAAVETLAEFLAWETCDENIDPLGTSFHSGSGLTLMNISGHRDGCNTSCPGDLFYPMLPDVRQATQTNINTGCDSEAVAAPTVLAITFVGDNNINLSWQDNSANETAYEVERSDDNDSSFGQIIQLPSNSTAYSDNTVTPGHTYFYRVRAKQGNTFSDYSNVAIAVTGVSAAESVLLNEQTVIISPNPTSGQVSLSVENQWIGKTEIAVFDTNGRGVVPFFIEVKTGEKQTVQLDLSGLSAGVFWVKMVQGKDSGLFKLVKNQ